MIRKLPQIVIQQIAAGEVVERPASVLKELVENSIDAESTQIKVEHEEGGLRWLRVSDNGVGISADDVPLVFESHATSKLQKLEDLDSLDTMGFRGEAMSSIAAVSRMHLWTSPRGASIGCRAKIEFGLWGGIEESDRRIGTEIVVENIFERLPVRSKFLKTPIAEARQLSSILKRLALSYPECEFSFAERGKSPRFHWPKQSRFDRCLLFFEATDAERWFEGETEDRSWKVHFVFLKPRFFQSARQNLQIYLNQRMIKDRKLEFAVRRAFEGYTETPHLSTGVIFLEGNPSEFDVNVHPTKMEIRFKDAEEVFSVIVHALRSRLEKMHQDNLPSEWSATKPVELALSASPSSMRASVMSIEEAPFEVPVQSVFSGGFVNDSWKFLGVIDSTYWITQKQGALFLFDQHALHERILYEDLNAQFDKKGILGSQRLLFPVDLQFAGREDLEDHRSSLEKLGFDWTIDSKGKWKLIAVPSLLKRNPVELLREALKGLAGSKETVFRDILATMACHSAIRAGDSVPESTAHEILVKFQSTDALGHCPHGRPTFVKLNSRDLEKLFHRV